MVFREKGARQVVQAQKNMAYDLEAEMSEKAKAYGFSLEHAMHRLYVLAARYNMLDKLTDEQAAALDSEWHRILSDTISSTVKTATGFDGEGT
jgi:hypothetical protein